MRHHIFVLALLAGCGPSGSGPDGGDGDGDGDGGPDCTDGATQCSGATFQTCNAGEWEVTQQCPIQCDAALGCVTCTPELPFCVGNDVHACTASGDDGGVTESCSGGLQCEDGQCKDLCAEAASNRSYIGCEYWAVDLDNAIEVVTTPDQVALFGGCAGIGTTQTTTLPFCHDPDSTTPDPTTGGYRTSAGLCDFGNVCPTNYTCETAAVCVLNAQNSPFAVVVSNPQTFNVDVTISDSTGTSMLITVPSNSVQSIFPQQLGFPNQSLDHTMKAKRAYKLVSTAPIVAYQFNPLDNVGVFSNDASLLLPRTTFDVEYIALTWASETRRPETNDYNGYIAVVAWQDGTQIEVTPEANVRAGANSVAAIAADATVPFTLDAYEVLNLEAVGDGDLTGSVIRSTNAMTFGVYAGHEAMGIAHNQNPGGGYTIGPCCADHTEEMMFPLSTWGKEFAIARSKVRLPEVMEPDVLRIMAQKVGTTVSFDPAPVQGTCPVLGARAWCQVEIGAHTKISATEPVMIAHYLKSVNWQTFLGMKKGTGDPSMAIAVPVEQFRTSYSFLIPAQYTEQYVSIVVPTGGTVVVDGNDVTSQLTAFGTSSYLGGNIMVGAGPHRVACPGNGCGIEVMGYSEAVSYMFAGGLDLKQIVVE